MIGGDDLDGLSKNRPEIVWVAKYKSGGDRSLKQTAAMWPPRVTVKRR